MSYTILPPLPLSHQQLLSALDYFHHEGLNYHTLQSENVLLWSRDPVSIKLSDSGITHSPRGCQVRGVLQSVILC